MKDSSRIALLLAAMEKSIARMWIHRDKCPECHSAPDKVDGCDICHQGELFRDQKAKVPWGSLQRLLVYGRWLHKHGYPNEPLR